MKQYPLQNKKKQHWHFVLWLTLCALLISPTTEAQTTISFQEVKDRLIRSDSRLYDRHGDLIHEHRTNLQLRQIGWTTLTDISPSLKAAVLLSEDKRFFHHHGVDWIAITRAAEQRLLRKSTQGASTISMQVATLLNQTLKPKRLRKEWKQKIDQIYKAIELERSWSKEQILETYLNLVSFRGELQGIASASRGLFGKAPSGLNQQESLILAALIRAPAADSEKVLARACTLAKNSDPPLSCESLSSLIQKQGLFPRPFPPTIALAPHVARLLFKQQETRSTLDRHLQAQVLAILRRQVMALHDRNMNDAAALVVDNQTGEVLAYLGNIGSLSSAISVDGVHAHRQAGSTLKPFLYSLALEQKYLTAASKLDDSVTDFSLGTGSVYQPKDFDHEFHGDAVTLRLALASSLNIPAVKTLQLIGVGRLIEQMNAMGFQNLRSEEFYGPSLALGTADVSLWELVNAYRTLANGGRWSPLTLSPLNEKQVPLKPVISPEAAFIIADILSDKMSRSLTFGLDNPLALRFWTAAKTGTSKDMRDNWCIGFSSRYTVGVWAGNFSGASMWNVTGVSGAAPAWAEIMEVLHRSSATPAKKDGAPQPPRGVIYAKGEWYIRGTEPSTLLVRAEEKPTYSAKILYPVEGLMIARDPDIPADHQRIFFESNSHNPTDKWVLNHQELAHANTSHPWQPSTPGNYKLQLVSAEGKILDQVHFSVRGVRADVRDIEAPLSNATKPSVRAPSPPTSRSESMIFSCSCKTRFHDLQDSDFSKNSRCSTAVSAAPPKITSHII